MEKLKKALSGEEEEERGIAAQAFDATTLSWSTRIKGFIVCFVLGIVLSMLGTFLLWAPDGLTLFAIFYSLGNIVALASTCFLMGPINQIKKMFAQTRLIATLLVFVFLALTLMAALWWAIPGLCIVFCLLQFLAMTWYSLSYIPFARDVAKKCFTSCIE